MSVRYTSLKPIMPHMPALRQETFTSHVRCRDFCTDEPSLSVIYNRTRITRIYRDLHGLFVACVDGDRREKIIRQKVRFPMKNLFCSTPFRVGGLEANRIHGFHPWLHASRRVCGSGMHSHGGPWERAKSSCTSDLSSCFSFFVILSAAKDLH